MSEDWGIKTGTLYFHLRELGEMIDQGSNKEYILTNKGKKLCQFFIREDTGRARVDKIDAFTRIAQPIYLKLENSIFYQLIIYTLMLGTLLAASWLKIYLVGPIPLPVEQDYSQLGIFGINLGIFMLQLGVITGITYTFGSFDINSVFRMTSLANTINIIFVTTILALVYLPLGVNLVGVISFEIWFIISVLSQIIYISIISGSLILGHKIGIEKSFLFTLLGMYLISSIALIISF